MRKVTISIEIEVETDLDERKIQSTAYQYCDDMATEIMSSHANYPSIDVTVWDD